MALTVTERQNIHDRLVELAEEAKRSVRGGAQYRATVLLRAPHLPDGDVIVTDDQDEAIIAAVQKASGDIDGPPGRWICRTCGFQITRAILRAHDGAVGVDRSVVEDICPNDGSSMRRVTWKEDAEDANRVGLEQMQRADRAESALEKLRAFAQELAGQEICDDESKQDKCTLDSGPYCGVHDDFSASWVQQARALIASLDVPPAKPAA